MDVGNFYLMTPLDEPEYMRFHISLIPDEIIEAYDLRPKVHTDGFVYIRIKKAMYGLPQSGFCPTNFSANVLHHMDTMNALTHQVFGNTKHDLSRSHLLSMTLASNTSTKKMHNTLNESSKCTTLSHAIGKAVSIVVSPSNGTTSTRRVYLSMPGYVKKAIERFLHILQNMVDKNMMPHTNTTHHSMAPKSK
jgi:hypothetical protein